MIKSILTVLLAITPVFGAVLPPLLSLPSDASRFSFFDLHTPLSGPCDLCTGPDGAIWFQDILVNKVGRIDPKTGVVTEYDVPFAGPALPLSALPKLGDRVAFSCAIQPGRDGHLYAAQGIRNQLIRINVTTKAIDVFTPKPYIAIGDLQPFNDLYAGETGMFFTQTTANIIGHFDYKTHEFKNFVAPTPISGPLGMFVAHDGAAYFAENLGNKIGRINATTGEIREYPVPIPALLGPAVIRVETENRYIWFTAFQGNGIGRLDPYTGEVKAFTNPSPLSFPAEDTLDGDGNIWFSTATQNVLNRLTPDGVFSQVVQPGTLVTSPVSLPLYFDIGIHYGPGNAIWFTEATANRIGRYQL